MVRDLSALLTQRYMVYNDRDAVLDALRFALPLDRTTDVGHVMHLRNDALRRGGTCWCRTRRQLVGIDVVGLADRRHNLCGLNRACAGPATHV